MVAGDWGGNVPRGGLAYAWGCAAELKDNFTLFVKKDDGKINLSELGTVLRALGGNPTEAEVKALQHKMDPSGASAQAPAGARRVLTKARRGGLPPCGRVGRQAAEL